VSKFFGTTTEPTCTIARLGDQTIVFVGQSPRVTSTDTITV
jgi:hypothetical protein